jgi:hypothetical protein
MPKTQYPFSTLLLRAAAGTYILLFLLSCGKRDDRNDVRAQNGEPDEIQTVGSDPFWRETWYYDAIGVGYEFRRTSGCGSIQDIYLNYTFTYPPVDDSTSTAVSRQGPLPVPSRSGYSPLSSN